MGVLIMYIEKWNAKTSLYDPHYIPPEWNVSCYESDMSTIVNCPACGKELLYADSYTSRIFHSKFGFGYAVCEACYGKEKK